MSGTVEKAIEQRLTEIEQQLRGVEDLQVERDRLTRALSELRGGATNGRRQGRRTRGASAGTKRQGGRRAGKRAPRGSNQQAILDYISANPGSTTPQIAEATGIARPVVYSATSRLSSAGRLRKGNGDGGAVVYEMA